MAAETGVPAIKRLLISLFVISAVACGAIYAVVTPPKPIIKPVVSEKPSRPLAYQQQIARPGEGEQAEDKAQTEGETQKHAMAPANAKPANESQSAPAPQPQPQAAAPAQQPQPPASGQHRPPDMAALPPDGEFDGEAQPYQDPDALPWQRAQPHQQGSPYPGSPYPGSPEEAYGPPGAWPGEDGYRQDAEAWPGEDVDPNAWPASPEEEPQEWVQVLVSGAGMHGMASEDAPMLFAFPFGRSLRLISRYGNWVEVTDPQSATTGWMKAQYLAQVARPRPREEMEAWYGEEPPRRRRGWFRRHGGEGIADMIGRALGGGY